MKALVKAEKTTGLRLMEVPLPEIGTHDVLIRVKKTGICGTDLHIWSWDDWAQKTIPTPMVVGHEYVGEVAAIGSGVTRVSIGDRVSGEGHIACGVCRNCRSGGRRHLCQEMLSVGVTRPGAFAEFVVIPELNVVQIPPDISDNMASILDPLGNATHTALAFDLVAEDVLVTGAGPIGIMAAAIAQYAGARHVVITDINDTRLELAKKLSITHTVNPNKQSLKQIMTHLGMTEGFDVGLETSGAGSALNTMVETMSNAGRMALLGIPPASTHIDWNRVIFKGLMLKGIYGRKMFETWYKMLALLQNGLNVEAVITHCMPATEYEHAFSIALSGQCGKVVLDWDVFA
jgi:threonine 3-dehydrogenase